MSLNVEVKINYQEDDLFCSVCKNRINLTEKYLVILEETLEDLVERKPVHLDCVEETPSDEDDVFIGE